jgi:oxaloacetate decarboxylase alpha subunit
MPPPLVGFVDTSLRDGPQSLWSMQLGASELALAMAPVMDEAGFEAIDLFPLVALDWVVRVNRHNPWERLARVAQRFKKTPLIVGGVLRPFGNYPDAAIDLALQRFAAIGMKRVRINEPTHDMERIHTYMKMTRAGGLESLPSLIYTQSPVHTDKYYARLAREICKAGPDRMFIKDVGGLLTPERVRTLVPAILKAIDGVPLELHGHCNTGLAPLCYLEAIKQGLHTVHTASRPAANGTSQPATENILANIRHLGYRSSLDPKALETMAEMLAAFARAEHLPPGAPPEFDGSYYSHQIPGGMIANYRKELAKRGIEHKLPELLEEMARIRRELGYPIMVTPLSQYVGVQAVLNVVEGKRYNTVPDETIHYVLGHYGPLAAPVEPAVMDRIKRLPRTRQLAKWEPPQPSIGELRSRFGTQCSDDELLLRVFSTNQQAVDEALAAPPMGEARDYRESPIVRLIRELTRPEAPASVRISNGELSLSIRK